MLTELINRRCFLLITQLSGIQTNVYIGTAFFLMQKAPYLTFALRGDQWVSIRSVASGLACGCHCPACGLRLMAKKGAKQQHHFAHYKGAECAGGIETILHRYAKEVLLRADTILLPAVTIYRQKNARPIQTMGFHKATREVAVKGLKIDIILENETSRLAVELKVKHAVSPYKQQRLIRMGLASIEIDVGRIYEELLANQQGDNLSALRQAILMHPTYRQWLFSPLQHKWEYRLAKEANPLRVVMSKQGDYHHYHVYRCPRRLRFVRNGFRDGQAYARVFQDCLHCQYCREIVYDKQWVAYQEISTLPKTVLCGKEMIG